MNTNIVDINALLNQVSEYFPLSSKLKASEKSIIYLLNSFSVAQIKGKKLEHEACLMIKDYLKKILMILDQNGKNVDSRDRVLFKLNLKKILVIFEMMVSVENHKNDFFQVSDEKQNKSTLLDNASILIKSQKSTISRENSKYIEVYSNIYGSIKEFQTIKKSALNEMFLILRIIRSLYDRKIRNHLINKYMLNMDINLLKTVISINETNLVKSISYLPPIHHNKLIFVPRTISALTRESILSNSYEFQVLDKNRIFFTSQNEEDSLVPIRFLSKTDPSNFTGTLRPETLVIYIHGGGYLSKTSYSSQPYTRKWSIELNLPVFCIDYHLAPESKFPKGLDDVWQAYVWLVNNSESILGVVPKKIVVIGSSAGGTLSVFLSFLCKQTGFRKPDGLLLAYPCFTLNSKRLSETSLASIEDPIIGFRIIELMRMAYLEDENDVEHFMVSPLNCPDYMLEDFPTVRMIVCLEDCLTFDSLIFAERILRVNGRVKILKYEGFLHGALSLANMKSTQSYKRIVDDSIQLISELIS